MKIKFITIFLFTIMFFALPGFAKAANYFNWGVESARMYYDTIMSQYNSIYFSGTTQDCGVAHSGSCSMKLNVIGNDEGNQSMGADNIQWNPVYSHEIVGSPEVFYRWWMKIVPGFSWGTGAAKTKSNRVISGAQGYTGYLMDYGFLIGECGGGGCLSKTGTAGTDYNLYIPYNFRLHDDNIWHEYIVKVKPNTFADCIGGVDCDAQFQAWVDGISVGEYNNFKLHNAVGDSMHEAWGGWMVRPYFQLGGTVSDGGTIYLDDFSTDNIFNSLMEVTNATPPSAPSGLGVN